ncbi:mucin-2-like [Penaeus chinensis]|uniref:mucin-2-like n=1 Tax=Penaeus chinensis TaxID=139456 RepID=UPI001FB58C44|nr:mucin-2-like [Penaeus chinensis]
MYVCGRSTDSESRTDPEIQRDEVSDGSTFHSHWSLEVVMASWAWVALQVGVVALLLAPPPAAPSPLVPPSIYLPRFLGAPQKQSRNPGGESNKPPLLDSEIAKETCSTTTKPSASGSGGSPGALGGETAKGKISVTSFIHTRGHSRRTDSHVRHAKRMDIKNHKTQHPRMKEHITSFSIHDRNATETLQSGHNPNHIQNMKKRSSPSQPPLSHFHYPRLWPPLATHPSPRNHEVANVGRVAYRQVYAIPSDYTKTRPKALHRPTVSPPRPPHDSHHPPIPSPTPMQITFDHPPPPGLYESLRSTPTFPPRSSPQHSLARITHLQPTTPYSTVPRTPRRHKTITEPKNQLSRVTLHPHCPYYYAPSHLTLRLLRPSLSNTEHYVPPVRPHVPCAPAPLGNPRHPPAMKPFSQPIRELKEK